jgi:Ankyrin repeats (3 copies)
MNKLKAHMYPNNRLKLAVVCILVLQCVTSLAQERGFDQIPSTVDLLLDTALGHTKFSDLFHWPRETNVFVRVDSVPSDVKEDCSQWFEYLLREEHRPRDFFNYSAFIRDPKPKLDQVWTRFRAPDATQIQLVQSCGYFTLAIKPAGRVLRELPSEDTAATFLQEVLKTYLNQGEEAAGLLTRWSRLEGQLWHFASAGRPWPKGWMENSDLFTDGTVALICANKLKTQPEMFRDCHIIADHWFDPPETRPRRPYVAPRRPGYADIHYAVEQSANNRSANKVKELIDKDPSLVNATTPEGYTPLLMAAGYGNKELVEFLLAHGANVNTKDRSGDTALHVGVRYNRTDVIEVLIGAGADINAKNNKDETPLDLANDLARGEAAKILRAHGAKTTITEMPRQK